jgi:hypothetical protein
LRSPQNFLGSLLGITRNFSCLKSERQQQDDLRKKQTNALMYNIYTVVRPVDPVQQLSLCKITLNCKI